MSYLIKKMLAQRITFSFQKNKGIESDLGQSLIFVEIFFFLM
jgi:hypothetical protein